MSVIAHGIDLVECDRIANLLEKHRDSFLARIYTQREQDDCIKGKATVQRLSGRFAVKEAVMKILGTGWRDGIAWTDIETVNDPLGKPIVNISGVVKEKADAMGITELMVTISHTDSMAIASCIAIGEK